MNQDSSNNNSASNGVAVPSVMTVKPLASAAAKASGDISRAKELSAAEAKKLADEVWGEANESQ